MKRVSFVAALLVFQFGINAYSVESSILSCIKKFQEVTKSKLGYTPAFTGTVVNLGPDTDVYMEKATEGAQVYTTTGNIQFPLEGNSCNTSSRLNLKKYFENKLSYLVEYYGKIDAGDIFPRTGDNVKTAIREGILSLECSNISGVMYPNMSSIERKQQSDSSTSTKISTK